MSSKSSRYYHNPYNNNDNKYDKEFCNLDNDSRCEYLFSHINIVIKQILQHYPIPINNHNSNIDYSIYEGYGGIAYMFYHLWLREEFINESSGQKLFNQNYLQQAELYINNALELMNNTHHKPSITFICGSSGLYSLGAVIQYKQNKINKCKEYLLNLIKVHSKKSDNDDSPNELFYGRAGLLYSILFVKNHLQQSNGNNNNNHNSSNNYTNGTDEELASINSQLDSISIILINEIIDTGISFQHSESPLMWSWHETNYFGAAHGVIGILHTLLFAINLFPKTEFGAEKLLKLITDTVDYLLAKRFDSGNLPSSEHAESDKYIQFCHGASALVIPLLQLFEITKNKIYHAAAVKAAECIWNRGLLIKGLGLCHGISGNAYCFLQLHYFSLMQSSEEKSTSKMIIKHSSSDNNNNSIINNNKSNDNPLERAWLFTRYSIEGDLNDKSIINKLLSKPDEPYSLFNGLAGAVCFWLDLIAGTKSSEKPKFPGFMI